MDLSLGGKVAIITGAGRGIGRAIALTFAREGTNVVVSDIDLAAATAVAQEAEAIGHPSLAIKADVTNIGEVRQMVNNVLAKFGRVDILINNAGVLYAEGKPYVYKLFIDSPEQDWGKLIDITLFSVLNCTKAVVGTMVGQKSGSIVNIVSDAGRCPAGPRLTIYGGGKGGIIAFSKHLAYELSVYGIRVNCVSPGLIEGTRIGAIKAGIQKGEADIKLFQEFEEMILKRVPLGRIGMPQDLANMAVFLASEAASYITGQTISVNGGYIMP
jgi:NAD(P)-dependent dehydrogenase (short-subunit alcohol dehydrogenase family)